MSKKIQKIKEALSKLIEEQFANYPSDKGLLVIEGDELEIGASVEIEDEDGNRTVAEDGVYTLEDGTKITVADGKITEIVEPEPAETGATSEAPAEAPAESDIAAEDVENPTNEGEETDTDAVVELRREVNELYALVDALTKRIEELEKKPAAAPASEEFEKVKQLPTNDKKMKNIQKFFE